MSDMNVIQTENSDFGSFSLPDFEAKRRWGALEARISHPYLHELNIPAKDDLERRLFKIPNFMKRVESGERLEVYYCKKCGQMTSRLQDACTECGHREKGTTILTTDALSNQKEYIEALLMFRGTVDLYDEMKATYRGDELPSVDVVKCMIFNPFVFKIMDGEKKIDIIVENDPNLADEKLGVWTDAKYKDNPFKKTKAKESIPASVNELLLSQLYPEEFLYSSFVQEKIENFIKDFEKRADELIRTNAWNSSDLELICDIVEYEF
ncbi:MAG: hypothetical protein JXA43_02800 [Candidatus Diapherotrites archaeon]|nr:hypothetical protein [Candidatus Diapherotrites archaeon]